MCYFTLHAATRLSSPGEIARAKRFSRFLRDFITICLSLKHASRSCSLLLSAPDALPPTVSVRCLLTLSCLDTYLTVEVHPREKRDGEAYFKWRVLINKFIWPFFSSLLSLLFPFPSFLATGRDIDRPPHESSSKAVVDEVHEI